MALQWKSGAGADLPDGGTTGQALVKKSDANQDVEWGDVAGTSIQVDTMPTAEASLEGKIYQYVGATDTDYTNGYFYECVEITPSTDPKTYEWRQKNVGGGGTVDTAMSDSSENAVQNKVIKAYVDSVAEHKADGWIEPTFVTVIDGEQTNVMFSEVGQRFEIDSNMGVLSYTLTQADIDYIPSITPLVGLVMRLTNGTDWVDIEAYGNPLLTPSVMIYEVVGSSGITVGREIRLVTEIAHQIDERLIPGGGGEVGMTEEVLFEAPTATVWPDVTLSESIYDYDMIMIDFWKSAYNGNTRQVLLTTSEIELNENLVLGGNDWVVISFDTDKHITGIGGTSSETVVCRKVVGITFGSSLDGTIGRWEKIGEWTTTTDNIALDLSKYQVLALTSYGGPGNIEKRNTAILRMDDFTVGTELESHIIADIYVYFKNLGNGLYKFGNSQTGGGILYGYKEVGISDADVRRIAAEVEAKDVIVNVTNNSGTYTADKTFAEMQTIIQDGGSVRASYDSIIYDAQSVTASEIIFTTTYLNAATVDNNVVYCSITIRSDDTVTLKLESARSFIFATQYPQPSAYPEGTLMLSAINLNNLRKGWMYRNVNYSGTWAWVALYDPMVITSPNGTNYKIVVANDGTLSTEAA